MFERSWTVVNPSGGAPDVITVQNVRLPEGEREFRLSAWVGSAGGNVYLMEGDLSLSQAQEQLGTLGDRIDCLMCIPANGGIGQVRIPGDIEERITVFWDTADTASQAVTFHIQEVKLLDGIV